MLKIVPAKYGPKLVLIIAIIKSGDVFLGTWSSLPFSVQGCDQEFHDG